MTAPKRNEAVAPFVKPAVFHVRVEDKGQVSPSTGFPSYRAVAAVTLEEHEQCVAALQGEVSRLEQRFSDMRKVLFRLHAAYCEVSPNMTRAQRHEGRLALIAATEAMHPQWQGLTNLEPPTDGR